MRRWTTILIILAVLSLPVLLLFGEPATRSTSRTPHVALIDLTGTIADSFGTIRPRETIGFLRTAQQEPNTRAVVVRINSGGGSPAASQEIYNEIRRTSELGKPVVVSMGDTAASGGYYIAAAGDVIVANPATVTASIGVIMQFQVVEDLLEEYGVVTHTLTTGQHKASANPFVHPTAANVELLQNLLNDTLEQFIADVANGRGMDPDDVRAIADGRIMTGRQAFEYGLVDQLGGLEEAIAVAGELAGISGRPHVVTLRRERTWQERLLSIVIPDWSPQAIAEMFGITPWGYTVR